MDIKDLISLDKQNISLKEIANKYNCTYQYVQQIFKKHNYKRIAQRDTVIRINGTFFKKIDSEIKSYLLGFFMADGGILKNGRIQICLSVQDEYIIDLFIKYICPDVKKEHYHYKKGAKNRKPQVKIRFNGEIILKDLEKFNIRYLKSNQDFKFIEYIPNHLLHHFIRGYFDGDGCISNYTKQSYLINISNSTKSVLEEIQLCFNKLGIYSNIKEKKNHSILTVFKLENIDLIGKYLYKNANFFLQRKKNLFDEVNTVVTNKNKKLLEP